ncbi:hypothetical protein [Kitasatospora sp. HPMI-4]|uniref:hypothetical protein n=1 Tax=Kitasatospora sp. HPMI-4 TaxID=3448443 RepID=UPI003F1D951B
MSRTPWHHAIDPADWAAMTRMHESSHVVASEALGIPVVDVWANPDRDVALGGQYRNSAADSQLQSVVYLIGAEGGAQELREAGYPEDLVEFSVEALGFNDRAIVEQVITDSAAQGYRLDGQRAQHDAVAILHSEGFIDTARNVAQALADQGDRLTGADVRAAMGGWELDGDLWVPAWNQLPPTESGPDRADSDAEMEIDL